MNCWEMKNCPTDRRDNCPAYPDRGPECWKVTGTMCGGAEQGDMTKKIEKCRECNYYQSPHCKKF
jgi:methyl-accepting chemotaxis protein